MSNERPSSPDRFADNFLTNLTLDDIYGVGRVFGDPKLAHWTPHYAERQLLLRLASSVSQTGRPTILDAACGSGLVSGLLAVDGHAGVIGVDPHLSDDGHLELRNWVSYVRFEGQDLWDVVAQFSPVYGTEIQTERLALLEKIREYQRTHKPIYERLFHESQLGNPLTFNAEVAKLQELTKSSKNPSPINMVLCSFMPLDIELTVPIRDGIYPDCIVYVRVPGERGAVGAGDFYNDPSKTACAEELEDEFPVSDDTVISLNPGRNYRTAARWRTTQNSDYSSDRRRINYLLGAEVVVQLRKDIVLRSVPSLKLEKYGFDTEIERGVEEARRTKRGDWVFEDRDFLASIASVSYGLFGSA